MEFRKNFRDGRCSTLPSTADNLTGIAYDKAFKLLVGGGGGEYGRSLLKIED
jgi:hypothetical protein